jgi:hypothetical protein
VIGASPGDLQQDRRSAELELTALAQARTRDRAADGDGRHIIVILDDVDPGVRRYADLISAGARPLCEANEAGKRGGVIRAQVDALGSCASGSAVSFTSIAAGGGQPTLDPVTIRVAADPVERA